MNEYDNMEDEDEEEKWFHHQVKVKVKVSRDNRTVFIAYLKKSSHKRHRRTMD